jgi:CHAT domain-containing protein/tetratricopeptide (TPR) repeat protein
VQLNLAFAFRNRVRAEKAQNLERAIAHYKAGLTVYTRGDFPIEFALAGHNLADVFKDRIYGDKAENLEQAIAHYEAALTIYGREDFQQEWASTQRNLATTYRDRIRGEKADNLDRAIAYYDAALRVYTRYTFPVEWAGTVSDLAIVYEHRTRGERAENLEFAIAYYEAALTVFTHDAFPNEWAYTQHNLATTYRDRIRGAKADNLERAIALFEAALTVFTREDSSVHWAMAQHNLANAYSDRIEGETAENLERAIALYEGALAVYTRDAFPTEWAKAQTNLANTYKNRIRGEKAENLKRSISLYDATLAVYTWEAFPAEWAITNYTIATAYIERICDANADSLERAIAYDSFLTDCSSMRNNLRISYVKRIDDEKREDLERAIAHYQAALRFYTRGTFPTDWAIVQHNLATAYKLRIRGDKAENLERTIGHYQAALAVYSHKAFPAEWALMQYHLACAYQSRMRGDKAENLERAIAHFEAALTVRTREVFPTDWAMIQSGLAMAYRSRIRGGKAENIERAIEHCQAALTIYTRDGFPTNWATVQDDLATGYWQRIRGPKAENLERAIAHFEAALSVRTREAFPMDWAETHNNLANAYFDRVEGEKAENRERAIAHYQAALQVYTREAFPTNWALLQHNLAGAYQLRIRGDKADNRERAITHYQAALTIHTRDTLPWEHFRSTRLLGHVLLRANEWNRALNTLNDASETFLMLFGEGLDIDGARKLIEEAGPLFVNKAYAAAEIGLSEQAFNLLCEGKARLIAAALRLQMLNLAPSQQRRLGDLRMSIREQSRVLDLATGLDRVQALDRLAGLREELSALIADGEGRSGEADALARTHRIVADSGVIVAPIMTEVGGKLLLVTAKRDRPLVTVLDLPEVTTARVNALLVGNNATGTAGWVSVFGRDTTLANRAIETIGRELWQLFVEPLARALEDLGVADGSRLIFLPSGLLGFLPLGLALEPSSGTHLLETYEIVHAPSLAALAKARRQIERPITPTLAAVVNPTGDLPFTPIEGALVAGNFDNNSWIVLDQHTATPEAAVSALRGKTYWHFSTHGDFDWADARLSGLAMKNGSRLNVGTLLEADDLGQPRLVVLSACMTGLHDIREMPEEFVGLPGAFMTIGAAAVLGTLWPVDDRATTLLIARFYDFHLIDGLSPAAALRRAQLWLRDATRSDLLAYARDAARQGRLSADDSMKLQSAALESVRFFAAASGGVPIGDGPLSERPYAHPIYWGGFVLTGL